MGHDYFKGFPEIILSCFEEMDQTSATRYTLANHIFVPSGVQVNKTMQRIRVVLRDRQYAYEEAQNIVETAEFWREELENNKLEMQENGLGSVCTPSDCSE